MSGCHAGHVPLVRVFRVFWYVPVPRQIQGKCRGSLVFPEYATGPRLRREAYGSEKSTRHVKGKSKFNSLTGIIQRPAPPRPRAVPRQGRDKPTRPNPVVELPVGDTCQLADIGRSQHAGRGRASRRNPFWVRGLASSPVIPAAQLLVLHRISLAPFGLSAGLRHPASGARRLALLEMTNIAGRCSATGRPPGR